MQFFIILSNLDALSKKIPKLLKALIEIDFAPFVDPLLSIRFIYAGDVSADT